MGATVALASVARTGGVKKSQIGSAVKPFKEGWYMEHLAAGQEEQEELQAERCAF